MEQLYGDKLGATDGALGEVKDFYFDDQNWAIRYLVADTGSWLPGRRVLLSPYSLGRLDQPENILRVKLTRKQIENSPSIDAHKPVSRQYEEAYYQYFGWPSYWQGDALWGATEFPDLTVSAQPKADSLTARPDARVERGDPHLRSAQAVKGYQISIGNKNLGHVCDFMMDAQSWVIGQLVIRTGHRLSGKEVVIPTKMVERISYVDSTIFVTMTEDNLEQSPGRQLQMVDGPVSPESSKTMKSAAVSPPMLTGKAK
jgi:hypothetical protein